jgi:hypothetical protein
LLRLKPFRIERPGCRAVMQLDVYEEPTGLVCSIHRLRGRIALPRRDWIAAVREEMHTIERLAIAAGCTEMRLGGRRWSRILPDYEPLSGVKNGLRKALVWAM